ncbi:MAG: NAD(+) diphosphatase [Rhodobacteraceae bacterium]|nr:NAD(+) diphosphatase [Paracoccaceae bacterium]
MKGAGPMTTYFAFAGAWQARSAELRKDSAALGALLARSDTLILPIWRGKPQFAISDAHACLGWVDASAPCLQDAPRPILYLGKHDGRAIFAADISGWEPDALDRAAMAMFNDTTTQHYPGAQPGHVFADLRQHMTGLNTTEAALAATARAIFNWHHRHGFCAACGQASNIAAAGWERQCPGCGAHHFPRTDPVVIMLVQYRNRVLLGRSPNWPKGMYSALAGFVEPGETIEAAVAREVAEETGVTLRDIRYVASQPWPFPSSLMLGCIAKARDTRITLDAELEDAGWFTREQILQGWSGQNPALTPARKGSIAHHLIGGWLAGKL